MRVPLDPLLQRTLQVVGAPLAMPEGVPPQFAPDALAWRSDADPPPEPSPTPRRYAVPVRPSPSPAAAPQEHPRKDSAPGKSSERGSRDDERRRSHDDNDDDDDERGHGKPEHSPPTSRKKERVLLFPLGDREAPPFLFTRQTSPEGRFIPMGPVAAPSPISLPTAYARDFAVRVTKRYEPVTAPGRDRIRWDILNPEGQSVAHAEVDYQTQGRRPSSFEASSRLDMRLCDARHPHGRKLKTVRSQTHLPELVVSLGVTANRAGVWKLRERRNGQLLGDTSFLIVEPPLPAESLTWARFLDDSYQTAEDASRLVAYTSDEWLVHSRPVVPALGELRDDDSDEDDDADERDRVQHCKRYTVEWNLWAPESEPKHKKHGKTKSRNRSCKHTYWTVKLRYLYDPRKLTYQVRVKVFDAASPKGRVLSEQEGFRIEHEPIWLRHGSGLPVAGTWKFQEKVNGKVKETRQIEARELSVALDVPSEATLDNGPVIYHMISEASPGWVPESWDWQLDLRDATTGNVVRSLTGEVRDNTANPRDVVAAWDGKDDAGAQVALGTVLVPDAQIKVLSSASPARLSARSARSAARIQALTTSEDQNEIRFVISGAVEDRSAFTGRLRARVPFQGEIYMQPRGQVQESVLATGPTANDAGYSPLRAAAMARLGDRFRMKVTIPSLPPEPIPPVVRNYTVSLWAMNTVTGKHLQLDERRGQVLNPGEVLFDRTFFIWQTRPFPPPPVDHRSLGSRPVTRPEAPQPNPGWSVVDLAGVRDFHPVGGNMAIDPANGRFETYVQDLRLRTAGLPIVIGRYFDSSLLQWQWTFQQHLEISGVPNFAPEPVPTPSPEPSGPAGDPSPPDIGIGVMSVAQAAAAPITVPPNHVVYVAPDGTRETFAFDLDNPGQGWLPTRLGVTTKLEQNGSEWRLTFKDKTKLVFRTTDENPRHGFLTEESNRNGVKNTYVWDLTGKRLQEILGPDPQRQRVTLTWPAELTLLDRTRPSFGPTQIRDWASPARTLTYRYEPVSDESDRLRLREVVQPGNKTIAYGYTEGVKLLSFSLAGRGLQAKYAGQKTFGGFLAEMTTADSNGQSGAVTSFQRLPVPERPMSRIRIENPNPSNTTHDWDFTLDTLGRVKATKDPEGNTEEFVYNPVHDVVEFVDSRSKRSKITYDSRRNITSIEDPLQHKTIFDWHPIHDTLTFIRDAQGFETHFGYDQSFINLQSIREPGESWETRLEYNPRGQLERVTDGEGHTWTYGYNEVGYLANLTAPTTAAGTGRWTFDVDEVGRRRGVTDPLGRTTTFSWDARDRLLVTTLPAVTARSMQEAQSAVNIVNVWDSNDLLANVTDPQGRVTHYAYDSALRLASIREPGTSANTSLKYDSVGQLLELTNARGATTKYTYDKLSRLEKIEYPAPGGTELFTYDANSNLKKWQRGSVTVDYDYDDDDELRLLTASTGEQITYVHNNLHQLQSISTPDTGTTTMDYWPDGQLQRVTARNRSLSYAYDKANRLRQLTDPESVTTTYGWNARDELESVTHDARTVTYGYDLAGNQVRTHLPNGVAGVLDYDERDRLVRKEYTHSTQPLLTLKYRHNQSGRRIQTRQDTPSQAHDWHYAYNDRNELTAANKTVQPPVGPPVTVPTTFNYDANYNRLSENTTTYTPNNADQLVQAGATSIRYNGSGQADQIGGGGLDATLTYNHRDQITAVNSNVRYRYDGFGQRVEKQVDAETTHYLWNGDEVLKEYTGTGAQKADYFLGAGREGIKTDSGWNWYLTDAQDSTVLLTDDAGTITAAYDYEPYGRTTQTAGNPGLYNPYRWTGQQFDDEAGMYYLRARHYHPRLGRFLARDPIGYAGGSNLYAYCENDPINYSDPSGLDELQAYLNGLRMAGTLVGTGVFTLAAAGSAPVSAPVAGAAIVATGLGTAIATTEGGAAFQAALAPTIARAYTQDVLVVRPPGPYAHLKDHPSVAPYKRVTTAQAKKVIAENRKRNGGVVKSDNPADMHKGPLIKPEKSMSGAKNPPQNEWQIDHVKPRSQGGSNGYSNLQVVSRQYNRLKSDK